MIAVPGASGDIGYECGIVAIFVGGIDDAVAAISGGLGLALRVIDGACLGAREGSYGSGNPVVACIGLLIKDRTFGIAEFAFIENAIAAPCDTAGFVDFAFIGAFERTAGIVADVCA